ncbi:MAG: PotD/PotF family extracellular solute-binding protein [Eubacterium sp.]
MKRYFLTIIIIVFASFTLAGCGKDRSQQLIVFNYGDYIDPEVLDIFEDETGIEVVYEEYLTPEAMYTKYMNGTTDYDVICTSDYIIEKLISQDEVLEFDIDSLTNSGNIGETYYNSIQIFDPDNKYAIPYFWGTVGILYNTTMIDKEITSWKDLFNEEYNGQIIMQNSVRDSFIVPLKLLGYSINTENTEELTKAQEMLLEQKSLVQSYLVDEIRDEMITGNAAISLVYSGEASYAMASNKDLKYVVPSEGSNAWYDCWFIPKTCKNKEAAEEFLDFLCREDIAQMNFDYVLYATPNEAVIDNFTEKQRQDETLLPSDESLSKCEVFKSLDDETMDLLSSLWKEIKAE